MYKVSIIVATLNRQQTLLDMLKRLMTQSSDFNEVIIIDQTRKRLKKLDDFIKQNPKIKYVYQKIKGMTLARNNGIKRAKGDILFFFDDDSFVFPDIIKAHLKNYKNPLVGAVTGREIIENNPKYSTTGKGQIITKKGEIVPNTTSTTKSEVDSVWGANMSFKKEVFEKIGLFDPHLLVRRDETDVSIRLKGMGYKIIFEPEAKIIHKTIPSGGTRNSERINWYYRFFRDERYFFTKYFPNKYLVNFYKRNLRAILSCMFYYGKGKFEALTVPFKAFKDGKELRQIELGNLAPIRIAIDGREAFQNNKAGKGYYTYNIVKSLAKIDRKNYYIIYVKTPVSKIKSDFELPANFQIKQVSGPGPIWFLNVLRDLRCESIDYLFSLTSFIFPYLKPKKCISFVYDLVVFRSDFKALGKAKLFEKTMLRRAVEKSPAIVSISNSTKTDLLKRYPQVSTKKITVATPAVNQKFGIKNNTLIAKIRTKYKLNKKYILSLGTLEPRKNYIGLISAYSKLSDEIKNEYDLVVVGKQGWYFDEIYAKVKELKLTKNVKFIGYVEDSEIPSIYAGAELFAYPAFWEGFGMPVLEAEASKIPVLTSNTSSLPEAGGDSAYYVDPHNVNDIAQKLEFILKNPQDRKDRAEKSLEHVKSFSWNKSAQIILDTVKKLIHDKKS